MPHRCGPDPARRHASPRLRLAAGNSFRQHDGRWLTPPVSRVRPAPVRGMNRRAQHQGGNWRAGFRRSHHASTYTFNHAGPVPGRKAGHPVIKQASGIFQACRVPATCPSTAAPAPRRRCCYGRREPRRSRLRSVLPGHTSLRWLTGRDQPFQSTRVSIRPAGGLTVRQLTRSRRTQIAKWRSLCCLARRSLVSDRGVPAAIGDSPSSASTVSEQTRVAGVASTPAVWVRLIRAGDGAAQRQSKGPDVAARVTGSQVTIIPNFLYRSSGFWLRTACQQLRRSAPCCASRRCTRDINVHA